MTSSSLEVLLRSGIEELRSDGTTVLGLRPILRESRNVAFAPETTPAVRAAAFYLYLFLSNFFYNLSGDLSLHENDVRIVSDFRREGLLPLLESMAALFSVEELRLPAALGDLLISSANSYTGVIHAMKDPTKDI